MPAAVSWVRLPALPSRSSAFRALWWAPLASGLLRALQVWGRDRCASRLLPPRAGEHTDMKMYYAPCHRPVALGDHICDFPCTLDVSTGHLIYLSLLFCCFPSGFICLCSFFAVDKSARGQCPIRAACNGAVGAPHPWCTRTPAPPPC